MIPLRRFAAYRNDADKMKRRTTRREGCAATNRGISFRPRC